MRCAPGLKHSLQTNYNTIRLLVGGASSPAKYTYANRCLDTITARLFTSATQVYAVDRRYPCVLCFFGAAGLIARLKQSRAMPVTAKPTTPTMPCDTA